jgi:MFS family permease
VVQQLNAALLFAAGFLVRPLGGLLFGYLADHQGTARRADAFCLIDVLGLPFALTVSIFGGTADSVASWFKLLGHEAWFYYYLTGMIRYFACGLRAHARHQSRFGNASS